MPDYVMAYKYVAASGGACGEPLYGYCHIHGRRKVQHFGGGIVYPTQILVRGIGGELVWININPLTDLVRVPVQMVH